MKNPFTQQGIIDGTPGWIKSGYVYCVRGAKSLLEVTGLLGKLDDKAREGRRFHYWRSLLAIYDVPDLVKLDVPWWTYEAIDYLEERLKGLGHPIRVFEWGSGASTLWLAKRADEIVSVEHDSKWHEVLEPFLENNIRYLLKEPDCLLVDEKFASKKVPNMSFKAYVTAIEDYREPFDVIVIDGRARNACLKICKKHLKETGVIVFDNSNRPEYQQGLLHSGMKIERFRGKVPASPFIGETAVLFPV